MAARPLGRFQLDAASSGSSSSRDHRGGGALPRERAVVAFDAWEELVTAAQGGRVAHHVKVTSRCIARLRRLDPSSAVRWCPTEAPTSAAVTAAAAATTTAVAVVGGGGGGGGGGGSEPPSAESAAAELAEPPGVWRRGAAATGTIDWDAALHAFAQAQAERRPSANSQPTRSIKWSSCFSADALRIHFPPSA